MSVSSRNRIKSAPSLRLSTIKCAFPPDVELLIEKESENMIVVSIREEIVERALQECHERYMEKSTIHLLVDCLHNAWLQMLRIGFLYYEKEILDFESNACWAHGEIPQPSPRDTWAHHSVPIQCKPKAVSEVTIQSINQQEVDEVSVEEIEEITTAKIETSLENMNEDDEVIQREISYSNETLDVDEEEEDEEEEEEQMEEDDEKYERVSSEASFFTSIAQTDQYLLPEIATKPCEESSLASESKTLLKDVKNVSFLNKLPPIRMHGKFHSESSSQSRTKL